MIKYIKAMENVLGRNGRNLLYTLPENTAEARNIADSKLKTKQVLRKAGIPVPDTYATIKSVKELDAFDWSKIPSSFALKPNKGFGGQGILICYGESKKAQESGYREWISGHGQRITQQFLYTHLLSILSGDFSLKNAPDRAIFEERLKNIPEFKLYLYKGVPDVRIIVYNKVPIMAELRLPTRESRGKANLHAGGVGVGIDIASGLTTTPILHDRIIETHPDTNAILTGIHIPHWDQILEMAIKAQAATGLGFLGVDIAFDKDKGPVILEVNARPGLAIQIANTDGLTERLARIRKLKIKTVKRGIRIAKELFGGEVEEEVETMLGKKIIGKEVKAFIRDTDGNLHEVLAKVDTGASFSAIDKELAKTIGLQSVIDYVDSLAIPDHKNYTSTKEFFQTHKETLFALENKGIAISHWGIIRSSSGTTIRPIVEIPIVIEGIEKKAHLTISERTHLTYSMLLGTRDLSSFIIDTTKKVV